VTLTRSNNRDILSYRNRDAPKGVNYMSTQQFTAVCSAACLAVRSICLSKINSH